MLFKTTIFFFFRGGNLHLEEHKSSTGPKEDDRKEGQSKERRGFSSDKTKKTAEWTSSLIYAQHNI